MVPFKLPLFDIFNSLRQRHGLPLGVDEYSAVLRSLQAGFGIGSRQEVEQLCCMVWAKSEEENHLVRRLFQQMWQGFQPLAGHRIGAKFKFSYNTGDGSCFLPSKPAEAHVH